MTAMLKHQQLRHHPSTHVECVAAAAAISAMVISAITECGRHSSRHPITFQELNLAFRTSPALAAQTGTTQSAKV